MNQTFKTVKSGFCIEDFRDLSGSATDLTFLHFPPRAATKLHGDFPLPAAPFAAASLFFRE
jgi:hypothetical protein